MNDKELKPYKAEYGIVPVVTRGGYPAEIIRVGMNALDGLSEYHAVEKPCCSNSFKFN